MTETKEKRVAFMLYNGGSQDKIGAVGVWSFHSTRYYSLAHTGDHSAEAMYTRLKTHIAQSGVLNEIVIGGHGGSGLSEPGMHAEGNGFTVNEALDVIEKLQAETGQQVTKRIVFSGCSVFSELDAYQIREFRERAKALHIELVGSTSSTAATKWGRYVQFTPSGGIKRDALDKIFSGDNDLSWVPYYAGRTQEEGERRFASTLARDIQSVFNTRKMDFTGIQAGLQQDRLDERLIALNAMDSIGLLLDEKHEKAIVVSSEGSIYTASADRKITPHPMTDQEKNSPIIRNAKKEIAETSKAQGREGLMPHSAHFTSVLMDDLIHAMLVSETGGYEVVDIKSDAPVSVAPRSQNRSVQYGLKL